MTAEIEIINNWTLKTLIDELENGKIKIPRFQRDYIWERTKVIKLLQSVYLQYPIGSIFLWTAPENYKNFIREVDLITIKNKSKQKQFEFILDGQQRIVSLYASLKGKKVNGSDYSKICFNVKKNDFHVPRTKIEKLNIPLFYLFDDKKFNQTFDELLNYDTKHKTNYALNWKNCRTLFENYPISIVKTKKENLDDVVEIFERINQGGSKLTLFDLVHATVLDQSFDLKDNIQKLNKSPDFEPYGGVSNRLIINSLAINLFENCSNSALLNLTPEKCKNIWSPTIDAIKKAIKFLIEMGIQTDLLQYHSIIPVLQYYFYYKNLDTPHEEHKKELEKWFWDTKFSNKYTSSNSAKIKEDIIWIKNL